MYRCPHAVKEDSPTRLSFFCLMFTSLASELTLNRLILCGSWRCCWQTHPFTIASTGPTQRSSRLLDGLIWGAAFTSVLFGNWNHSCFYFGMEIQISLGFFFSLCIFPHIQAYAPGRGVSEDTSFLRGLRLAANSWGRKKIKRKIQLMYRNVPQFIQGERKKQKRE